MATAEIFAGNCGFSTQVEAKLVGKMCQLTITSDCSAIRKLAEDLKEVNPIQEISSRRAIPKTLEAGLKYCTHAACPVPAGIIKAVEVEAKLALPQDVTIKLSK